MTNMNDMSGDRLKAFADADARCRRREREVPNVVDGNPLAAWEMLRGILATTQEGEPVPLPAGVRAYLEQVAWRLSVLAQGRDPATVARREGATGGVALQPHKLTPRQCAERVPAALGLVAPRVNRFSERRRDNLAWGARALRAMLLADGGDAKAARAAALRAIGKPANPAGDPADAARSLRKALARTKKR